MIAVVDYCKGNLKSVERGLRAVGGEAVITDNPALIERADAIVLPGVGAFTDASETMLQNNQMKAIRRAIYHEKPFLGICLGEHLIFSQGVEGAEKGTFSEGLGFIDGVVDRLPEYDDNQVRYKIPHVGWNSIEFDEGQECPLLEGISSGEYFYFTHSYVAPLTDSTVATTTHSITFPSVVRFNENGYGVQFHPEKSSDAGLKVLKNFLSIVNQASEKRRKEGFVRYLLDL